MNFRHHLVVPIALLTPTACGGGGNIVAPPPALQTVAFLRDVGGQRDLFLIKEDGARADNGASGSELWKNDGTEAGTVRRTGGPPGAPITRHTRSGSQLGRGRRRGPGHSH